MLSKLSMLFNFQGPVCPPPANVCKFASQTCCLSWPVVCFRRQATLLLYHAVFRLSTPFWNFFQGQRRILFAWFPLLFVPFQVYLEICCLQQISEDWRRFSGGCLCDSLYIISCHSPFVNTFFYLFYLFFCLFSLPTLFFPLLRLFYGKLAAYNHCCPVVITWNCPCMPLFSLHCICTNQQHIKWTWAAVLQ